MYIDRSFLLAKKPQKDYTARAMKTQEHFTSLRKSIELAAAIGQYMMTSSLRRRLRVWENAGLIPPAGTNVGGVYTRRER